METKRTLKGELRDELIAVGVAHGLTDAAIGELVGADARTVRRRRNEPVVAAKAEAMGAERVAMISERLGQRRARLSMRRRRPRWNWSSLTISIGLGWTTAVCGNTSAGSSS